ncbi:substrate-binding periplasmic protein [Colwellia hornerae]|uniref:Amino acid ABC transporter substrate-binding protein n=1 Tax=Colwellia hornerae TaxID=89402 RepID=A0A5C6Q811_9GAMM|nr:ABC transporter substrate-binding protein [Colwellia hornerae]TWX50226.1 amino acid ABC transporter substrate-binding protein [Colwellia hornerae]TWX56123.1 amino acid ABC transporter substrate-binding protein [Colwellia hornerae]TWX65145.1 amino acid ABC transporter substrate-binding protein [Colwellia hornerae]
MNRFWLCTLLIVVYFPNSSISQTMSFNADKIPLCAGAHEWPPYHYFKRVDGKKTEEIIGVDIDIFDEIFTKNGIHYSVELLPWKRCLHEAMKGEIYDVVFGAGLNDSRRDKYVTTKGYYTVVPSFIYVKEKFPSGVKVEVPSDLKKYGQLCGVRGFNYVNFGQKNEEVDMGSSDYHFLIKKTLALRCDISLVRYEILAGWDRVLNMNIIGDDWLILNPVPNNPPESFHLMISKNYKYSDELKFFFESEVNKLKRSGKFKSILSKYTK